MRSDWGYSAEEDRLQGLFFAAFNRFDADELRQLTSEHAQMAPIHLRLEWVDFYLEYSDFTDPVQASVIRREMRRLVGEPQNDFEARWLDAATATTPPELAAATLAAMPPSEARAFLALVDLTRFSDDCLFDLATTLARATDSALHVSQTLISEILRRDHVEAFVAIARQNVIGLQALDFFVRLLSSTIQSRMVREILEHWDFSHSPGGERYAPYNNAKPDLLTRCEASEDDIAVAVSRIYLANELWKPAEIAPHCQTAIVMTLVAQSHPDPLSAFQLLTDTSRTRAMDVMIGEHQEFEDAIPF